MLGIRCSKHTLYNGAKFPAEECDACTIMHGISKMTHYVERLERIQPINMIHDLSKYSIKELLAAIEKRVS